MLHRLYVVSDHSNGNRKRWPFADLVDAEAEAVEIGVALNQGLSEKERWAIGLRLEMRKALRRVEAVASQSKAARNDEAKGQLRLF